MAKPYLAIQKHSNFETGARQCWSPFFSSYPMPFIIFDPCMNLCESPRHLDIFPWATASSVQARLPRHQLRRPEAKNWKFLKEPSFKNNKTTHIIYIYLKKTVNNNTLPSFSIPDQRCPTNRSSSADSPASFTELCQANLIIHALLPHALSKSNQTNKFNWCSVKKTMPLLYWIGLIKGSSGPLSDTMQNWNVTVFLRW